MRSSVRPAAVCQDDAVVWVVDLDGVVWRAAQPIAGSAEALNRIQEAGRRVVLCTNNSTYTVAQYRRRLVDAGVKLDRVELVTSAQAAATLLAPGSSALVLAGPGVVEALRDRSVEVVEPAGGIEPPPIGPRARDGRRPDAVVIGWDRAFDLVRLSQAQRAVHEGARLIGTNEDATFPTPDGLLPGTGAFLAAVETASGTRAEVAGKPHEPMVRLVRQLVAGDGKVEIVVGDRPATDGQLARALNAPFGLVLSGVTGAGEGAGGGSSGVPADRNASDLAALVAELLD